MGDIAYWLPEAETPELIADVADCFSKVLFGYLLFFTSVYLAHFWYTVHSFLKLNYGFLKEWICDTAPIC